MITPMAEAVLTAWVAPAPASANGVETCGLPRTAVIVAAARFTVLFGYQVALVTREDG